MGRLFCKSRIDNYFGTDGSQCAREFDYRLDGIHNERVLICWESYEKAVSITCAARQTRDSQPYFPSPLRTARANHGFFLCVSLWVSITAFYPSLPACPQAAASSDRSSDDWGRINEHVTEASRCLLQIFTNFYGQQNKNDLLLVSFWLTGALLTLISIYFCSFDLFLEPRRWEMIGINHYPHGLWDRSICSKAELLLKAGPRRIILPRLKSL